MPPETSLSVAVTLLPPLVAVTVTEVASLATPLPVISGELSLVISSSVILLSEPSARLGVARAFGATAAMLS